MRTTILAAMAVAMLGGTAIAQEFKPAIVFDRGGKFDKSFNEAAYNGIEKFKKETNTEYRDFEITNDAQREQAMQRFARDGHNPVIVIGFSFGTTLEKVAKEFPTRASPSSTARSTRRTCARPCSRSMRAPTSSA